MWETANRNLSLHSEVIRAIALEDSLCCGVPTSVNIPIPTALRRAGLAAVQAQRVSGGQPGLPERQVLPFNHGADRPGDPIVPTKAVERPVEGQGKAVTQATEAQAEAVSYFDRSE